MTTRSVWDDLTDQAKEAIREVDKQLDAADALADVAGTAEHILQVVTERQIWEGRPAAKVVALTCLQDLTVALREYREVSK